MIKRKEPRHPDSSNQDNKMAAILKGRRFLSFKKVKKKQIKIT